jgi:TolB-like protein/Tfp pilus assembly protein PilF
VEFFGSIFQWIGTNESVLSGVAATFVILGVLYVPIRMLIRRWTHSGEPETQPQPNEGVATALHTDSPSIAVMPFTNLSGDAEQDFLADGLTEDIIFGLSRFKQLFVIARNTCFTYKGTTPDAQVVSRELGVRYVLEGSVRKTGDRIRVTAQLVDAATRTPKWAERFDRKLEEILEVDDEVTEAIVTALQPALRRAEAEHARRASPDDLTAWALVNRAWVAVQSDLGDDEAADEAVRSCDQALALDPDYAFAHAVLAHAKSLLVHRSKPHAEKLSADAITSIRRALELAPDDALVHHCHAAILGNLGSTDDAIQAWQRAIELDPNNAGARAGLGIAMIFKRRAEESLELIDGALRRSPADPLQYHWLGNRALALALTGRAAEAIEVARASLQRKPSRLAYAVFAGALASENRLEEAGQAWSELDQRFEAPASEDFARMAAALAPDPEWGKVIERGLRRAAEAAGELGGRTGE